MSRSRGLTRSSNYEKAESALGAGDRGARGNWSELIARYPRLSQADVAHYDLAGLRTARGDIALHRAQLVTCSRVADGGAAESG